MVLCSAFYLIHNRIRFDVLIHFSTAISIPVVALGGAGQKEDLARAYREGYANGLAAGSLFVYQGTKRGVLINYPDKNELSFE